MVKRHQAQKKKKKKKIPVMKLKTCCRNLLICPSDHVRPSDRMGNYLDGGLGKSEVGRMPNQSPDLTVDASLTAAVTTAANKIHHGCPG